MSLFQSIIIEKYVRELDNTQLETAWQTYSHCFLNLSKQDNIRLSKEEQYQEGFLRDLFVDVFGYTLNPNPDYDITTEFKNQTGSKKADGAILKDGHAIGVIELKGMNTTDLSKIEQQAFGYKNNQPKCRYVITSNFQKLRLYIDNAVEFIEFNLFTLTQDDFALLYLLLHRDGIMGDLPAKLKSASLSQEEAITKQLYKDYSVFKRELFNDLTTNNPSVDSLVLFQKSQKLLDRLLFIFFAEDSHLLPANFAKGIISEWEQLKSLKMTVPLYDRVKAYFGYLDKSHKDEHSEIFAYNGGLFSTDELLDSVIISDNILYTHIKILSEYDFDSEVDVNILGHIFENSLSELDEVKAQLDGTAVDKSQTKRKKDGVFYTPKYITKYIVENTVGKLCTDKKLELGINEEDYQQEAVINKDGTKRKKTDKQIAKEKVAFDNLNAYRDWLLQITICDPAVGSGAFLNEALNFLIAEHEYIVELETKLFGSGLAYPDIENSILENNLFGVDINEESVEIAKLSLWLRTAQPRRKLNNLNDNIKCGNSLIDDPAVAGDKAFNWQTAFPQVFAKGGFDVVIGNPPYGVNFDEKTKSFLSQFDALVPDFEIYIYFISLYTKILKKDAYLSYIFPNTFLSTVFGKKYRRKLLNHINLLEIVDLSNEKVFSDASVRTIIFSMKNNSDNYSSQFKKTVGGEIQLLETYSKKVVLENHENMASLFNQTSNEVAVIDKIKQGQSLDYFFEVSQGLIPYDKYRGHDENTIKNRIWHSTFKKDETFRKELKGADVNAYSVSWNGELWVSYGNWLAAPREPKFFTQERILIREITNQRLKCGYTELEYYNTPSLINLINEKGTINLKYALCILNSKLIGWYHNKTSPKANKGLFPKILVNDVRNIPLLFNRAEDQQPYIEKADLMLALSKELQDIKSKFTRSLQRKFDGLDKLSKKLQSWHELTYAEFIKELGKKKIKMSLGDEAEWEEYFLAEQTKAKQLIAEIERTDREIDQMVYKLYDLNDDEIAIIEAS